MADRDRAAPILELALDYIGRGWNPVPVNYRAKKPNTGTGWQLRVIDAANAPHYFNGGQMNIGVMLGPSSCGLAGANQQIALLNVCFGSKAQGMSALPPKTDIAETRHRTVIGTRG